MSDSQNQPESHIQSPRAPEYDPVVSVTVTRASGKSTILKRSGVFPDIFTADDGRIYTFRRCPVEEISNQPAVRYRGYVLMARHLIADAWMPGWEDGGHTLESLDGNKFNLHYTNLAPTNRGRGRPRGGRLELELRAIELLRYTNGDLEAVGAETGLSRDELVGALRTWAPALLRHFGLATKAELSRIGVPVSTRKRLIDGPLDDDSYTG